MDNTTIVKETVIKDNQPVEILLYAPVVGIIYVAAMQITPNEEINRDILRIANGRSLLSKETYVA